MRFQKAGPTLTWLGAPVGSLSARKVWTESISHGGKCRPRGEGWSDNMTYTLQPILFLREHSIRMAERRRDTRLELAIALLDGAA